MGRFSKSIQCLAVCTALYITSIGAPAADLSTPHRVDIAAQPLATALVELSRQTDAVIVAPAELVEGKRAPKVSGKLALTEALQKLLNGSGLRYSQGAEGEITILADKGRIAAGGNSDIALAQALPSENETAEIPAESAGDKPSEVVVTGTHIRGVANVGSPVLVIDREQIRQSGYANVPDVLSTLPQLFSGTAQNIDGVGTQGNFGHGFSVDLRGLGAGTTLILVDGRRQTASGLFGNFVDVSSIPLAAVERIEVLTDGATATYGSDAIGGVVNIILRKDFRGAESRARYASYDGDADEVQISQLLGTAWSRGNATLGLQYQKRTPLLATDRSFSDNGDQTSRGGSNWNPSYNNPGNLLDPFTGLPLFVIPRGQDGTALTPDELLPFTAADRRNAALGSELVNRDELKSVYGDISQRVTDRLELYASGRYSQRPNHNDGKSGQGLSLFVTPENPFFVDLPAPYDGQGFVTVDYNLGDDTRFFYSSRTDTFEGTLGSRLQVGSGWRVQLSGSLARESLDFKTRIINGQGLDEALGNYAYFTGGNADDPGTPYNPLTDGFFNPFGDGSNSSAAAIAAISRLEHEFARSRTWNATALADGPVLNLPHGALRLAVGADYRSERLDSGIQETRAEPLSRDLKSLHAELAAPVAEHLSLFAAARYEDYSDFGSAVTPKIGASWRPIPAITLRGTWGQSYKAPSLTQTDSSVFNKAQIILNPFISDPQAPSGFANGLFIFGVNPSLHEERANIWTAGMDIHPASVPNLSVGLTYHSIDYTDRITTPGVPGLEGQLLLDEAVWAPFITRNPSQSQIDALCNDPRFFTAPSFCVAFTPTVIIDTRLTNLASLKETGLDASMDYGWTTRVGAFRSALAATYAFKNSRRASSDAASLDIIDTYANPLAFRARGTIKWQAGALSANAAINFAKDYRDRGGRLTPEFTFSAPRRIDSWTTLDLCAAYLFQAGSPALAGLEVRMNIVNVFAESPPFVDTPYGFDPGNALPYGRLMSLELLKSW